MYMTRLLSLLCFTVLASLLLPSHLALAATGTLYQNTDDSTGQTNFTHSSASMTIDGALESITGQASGTSYQTEVGSQTNPGSEGSAAPEVTDPTTYGSAARKIAVDNAACTVAYSNLLNMTGTKTSNIIFMFVNGELPGFYFPDSTHWQRTLWLKPGNTTYDFFGRDKHTIMSNIVSLNLAQRSMGDINGDQKTNEYDLSLLTNSWEKRYDCATDLNRDNITDEYDLSLLITNWHE